MWGILLPVLGVVLFVVGIARYFPDAEVTKQLARLWEAVSTFTGPMIFAAAGILARHTSEHGRFLKTGGKEGAKMNWGAFWRDMIAAPLWAVIAGSIVEWGFHGPFYATLAVAGTAGYLAPFLTDIVLDGLKRVIAAATDRVRGGPSNDGGGV